MSRGLKFDSSNYVKVNGPTLEYFLEQLCDKLYSIYKDYQDEEYYNQYQRSPLYIEHINKCCNNKSITKTISYFFIVV